MMFHMAGVALKYRDKLKEYLTDNCALNPSNALRMMLTKGIQDDNLFLQLEAPQPVQQSCDWAMDD